MPCDWRSTPQDACSTSASLFTCQPHHLLRPCITATFLDHTRYRVFSERKGRDQLPPSDREKSKAHQTGSPIVAYQVPRSDQPDPRRSSSSEPCVLCKQHSRETNMTQHLNCRSPILFSRFHSPQHRTHNDRNLIAHLMPPPVRRRSVHPRQEPPSTPRCFIRLF